MSLETRGGLGFNYIMDAVRETARELYRAGHMDDEALRIFEYVCQPPEPAGFKPLPQASSASWE